MNSRIIRVKGEIHHLLSKEKKISNISLSQQVEDLVRNKYYGKKKEE